MANYLEAEELGPTEQPKCPHCGNSFQNERPDGSPSLLRCADCKSLFRITNIDRIIHLRKISELEVRRYKKAGVQYFVFGNPSHPIKTVPTYPKAKMFAQGIAVGRALYEASL